MNEMLLTIILTPIAIVAALFTFAILTAIFSK